MPALKHVHTYVKYKNRPGYWRCDDKLCTHFIDKERVKGKLSRCNSCGAVFELTYEDLRRVKPVCVECSNTKEAKQKRKVSEIAEQAIEIYATTQAKIPSELDELPYNDEEERF